MANVKDRVMALCKERGISINKLQKDTGIGNIVSRWDIYNPRADKLQVVADYFNVPIEILTGKQSMEGYLPTEKTMMVLTDIQEIDVITMLRELDTIGRYYIYGKIAELLKYKNEEAKRELEEEEDEDDDKEKVRGKSSLSVS